MEQNENRLVAVNTFVTRQTKDSPFSYFSGDWSCLIKLVEGNFDKGVQGYRDGVLLVPIPVCSALGRFYSDIVTLKEGAKLEGTFKARQPGEDPRISVYAVEGEKISARTVQVVLYRADVLAEDDARSTPAQWEIIAINASPTEEEVPISVDALIANHFQFSGGTATNLSDHDFVAMLRKSALFWKDKALLKPNG